MSLRTYLDLFKRTETLLEIDKPVSKYLEAAGILKALEPQPVSFQSIKESEFAVMGNLFCTKQSFADYLDIPVEALIPTLTKAIDHPGQPEIIADAPCQEVIVQQPDLDSLPILFHCEGDGGNYISSGVMIAGHPAHGQNMDFHRCMQFSKTEMAVRVVKTRHFDTFLQDLGTVDVAICVGVAPNILVAAATSVEIGVDELGIAHALEPFSVTKAVTSDLLIPAEAEFVIEGTIYRDRRHAEGPFVDLTETQDVIREEPVLEVKCITHRKDPLWHALLPGGLEHKLLMGMPREPTIFREVNKVVNCLDVNINPGGCSWLHAIVKIRKEQEDDGRKAIEAASRGHRSCKHIFIVDEDVDIYDPLSVEWAMATRFQADRDLVWLGRERGSSLDPSAEPGTYETCKVGFDLTAPLETAGKHFNKVPFPEVNLSDYL
ncbi:MAG: UbiD family decarboxylase [Anaerolineaceae bacterium]|nr:UbiD family decarboxylase [Anaerolineaceae bacterium]